MRQSAIRQVIACFTIIGLLTSAACQNGEDAVVSSEEAHQAERSANTQHAQIWAPDEGDHLWVFAESKDNLGSGGEFHIYMDSETHPDASASFSRFALGVGGALHEHRHEKTEEIAYFVSGEGVGRIYVDGKPSDVPVAPGYVWYNPPNVWHSIANTADEPLVMVFATIPNEKKGLLSFFRRISVKPGEDPTTLPPEEFAKIAAEHDMILKPSATEPDTLENR